MKRDDPELQRIVRLLQTAYSLHRARIDLLKGQMVEHNEEEMDVQYLVEASLALVIERINQLFDKRYKYRPYMLHHISSVQMYMIEALYDLGYNNYEIYYRLPYDIFETPTFIPKEFMYEHYRRLREKILDIERVSLGLPTDPLVLKDVAFIWLF